jgi:ankyrin repeat protein
MQLDADIEKAPDDVDHVCIKLLVQNTTEPTVYKSNLAPRVQGTCEWILRNSQYLNWSAKQTSSLLWIIGHPGCGKTTLSAYIMDVLSADEKLLKGGYLCYFFCNERIETQRDAMTILRSIIYQILVHRRKHVRHVKNVYNSHGPELEKDYGLLWKIFLTIASLLKNLIVVIDAIDECEEGTRDKFLDNIADLTENRGQDTTMTPSIKFVITSRPFPGRRYDLDLLQLNTSVVGIGEDIKLFINTRVDSIVARKGWQIDIARYLKRALNAKADGSFLWVDLVIQLVEKMPLAAPRKLQDLIDKLPGNLHAAYNRHLNEIPHEHSELAKAILHIIVATLRPMTLSELRAVIAIQDACRTLAEVEDEAPLNIQNTVELVLGPLVKIADNRVSLVHLSLKEYLQTLSKHKSTDLIDYAIDPAKANILLAKKCISYLLLNDFKLEILSLEAMENESMSSRASSFDMSEETENMWDIYDLEDTLLPNEPAAIQEATFDMLERKYPFFDYAARFWTHHYSLGTSQEPEFPVLSNTSLYDAERAPGSNWFRYYWQCVENAGSLPQGFVPLLTASFFGHTCYLKQLLAPEKTTATDQRAKALYWAARSGHLAAVDALLATKLDIDAAKAEEQGVLIGATKHNREEVIGRLLQEEAYATGNHANRINATGLWGRTALSYAASGGFIGIAKQLLAREDINVNKGDESGWTPIFWAAGGNHAEMVRLLLSHEHADINHKDKNGRNVLSWAAAEGCLDSVKVLIKYKELEVDSIDREGRSAFSHACGTGQLDIVTFLRRKRSVDISKADANGRTPLSWACAGSHYKVVQYLLKHDSKVDQPDDDGWTPLAWSLTLNSPKTVQILLNSGKVDVNKRDEDGRTPLSYAAGYGFKEVVELLLDMPQVDVTSRDNSGQTALDRAMRDKEIYDLIRKRL